MKLPTYEDVQAAARRIAGVAHRTPVFTSRTIDEALGAKLFFKCENFQRMGAFKFRGGYNALAAFTPEQRKRGALAFSSGNHAQAVALAARLLQMPAVILMPHDAPALKIAATRGYGAEVVIFDRYKEDREALARKLAEERGMTLGQAALKWVLADPIITSAQPNIYDLEQLEEFAAAPDLPDLSADDLERVAALYARNFDLEPAGV